MGIQEDGFSGGVELRDYTAVLRRQRGFIALLTLLGLGLGIAATVLRPEVYVSAAKVLVRPINLLTQDRVIPIEQLISMETEVEIAGSATVAELAANKLKSDDDPRDLLDGVTVENPLDTQILRIGFSGSSPEKARDAAQAFAEAYLQFKRDTAQESAASLIAGIQEQMVGLQEEIATVEGDIGKVPSGSSEAQELRSVRDVLIGQLAILRGRLVAVPTAVDPGEVIAPASLPSSAASPRPVVDITVALLMGLFVGVLAAFFRDRSDDRVRDRDDALRTSGAPALWELPPGRRRHAASHDLVAVQDPDGQAAERYRVLAGALMAGPSHERVKTLLIAGTDEAEDSAAATAANIATVLAQAGKRVALVGAERNEPRLGELFGLSDGRGLAEVVSDSIPLRQVVQTTDVNRLAVVTGGSSATHDVLQSRLMQQVLDELRESVDFTVLQTRPLVSSADAPAIAPLVDGVILVADTKHTTRRSLARARRALDAINVSLLGVVLHNARAER